MSKKYYWLKLKRDFFKRHDMQIIESMANGKDYILFYLKMLVESVDHEGHLRFNDLIPYNETMLATITNTNVDIVRSAMKVFTELHLIDVMDDQTIYMAEVVKMTGGESYWAQQKRTQRIGQCPDNVLVVSNLSNQEKEKELEKELDKDKRIKTSRFTPPTLEEVSNYCLERKNKVSPEKFVSHYEANGWMRGKNKIKDWKACVRTWELRDKETEIKPKNQNFSQSTISTMSETEMKEILKRKAERKQNSKV